LKASSVGCDSLVTLYGEELNYKKKNNQTTGGKILESGKGEERKKTCIVGIWIVWASSPFKLSAVGG
jgi:hypothetical protein